jgi:hypothetical protein
MADVLSELIAFMQKEGQEHIAGVYKTIPKKRDKKRENVAKKVKFIKNITYHVINKPDKVGIEIRTERIEGSLLEVTAEWMRLKGMSGQQYSVWAVAKTLAKEGVADVVFINNRRLKKMKDRIDDFATNIQIKLNLSFTQNISFEDLKLEL